MSIEAALFSIISGANSSAGSRVYPLRMPDEPVISLVIYDFVSRVNQTTRDNNTGVDVDGSVTAYSAVDELMRDRVQLDLIGKTYEAARVLETELIPYLTGFNGTVDGVEISRIIVDSQNQDYEIGGETYRRIVDLIVWHHG